MYTKSGGLGREGLCFVKPWYPRSRNLFQKTQTQPTAKIVGNGVPGSQRTGESHPRHTQDHVAEEDWSISFQIGRFKTVVAVALLERPVQTRAAEVLPTSIWRLHVRCVYPRQGGHLQCRPCCHASAAMAESPCGTQQMSHPSLLVNLLTNSKFRWTQSCYAPSWEAMFIVVRLTLLCPKDRAILIRMNQRSALNISTNAPPKSELLPQR